MVAAGITQPRTGCLVHETSANRAIILAKKTYNTLNDK